MTTPYLRAEVLLDADQYQSALEVLSPQLAHNPDDAHALCLAARALLGLDQLPRALQSAQRAVVLDPDEEWPVRLVSVVLMRMRRFDEALAAAEQARRLAPFAWQTHVQRAQVDVAADRVTETTRQFAAEALRLAPHEPQTHRMIGIVALELGSYDEADEALRRALRIDPHDTLAAHELARLQLKRRRLGAAAVGFADVAASDPTARVAVHNLTVVGARALRTVHLVLWAALFLAGHVADGKGSDRHAVIALCALAAAGGLGFLGWQLYQQAGRRTWRVARQVAALDHLLAAWGISLLVAFVGLVLAAIWFPGGAGSAGLVVAAAGIIGGTVISWIRAARLRRTGRRG